MAPKPDGPEGRDAEARRAELLSWCRAHTDDVGEALAWARRLEAFVTGGLGPADSVTPGAPDPRPGESAGPVAKARKEALPMGQGAREGAAISSPQRPDETGQGEIGVEAKTGAAACARQPQGKINEGATAASPEPRRRVQVLALIERAAEDGRRCPSNAEIAGAVGVGTQAASAAVQRLAQAGDIAIEKAGPTGRVVFVPKLGKRTAPLSTKAKATRRMRAAVRAKPRSAPAKAGFASGSAVAAIGRDIRAAIPEAFSAAQREAVLAAAESLAAIGGERVETLAPGLWRVEGRRATAEDLVKRASHQRRMAGLEPIAWPRRGASERIP